MQFLRTLFWILITVVVVVFSIQNWKTVDIALSSIHIEFNLPVLLIATFLTGLLPTLIVNRMARWRLLRRLETAERALQQIAAPAAPPQPAAEGRLLPPGSVPSAVPPGVS